MFEKFSNLDIDSAGRGGEYTVQAGFGWTNGVLLWVASNYGGVLAAPTCPPLLDANGESAVSSSASSSATGSAPSASKTGAGVAVRMGGAGVLASTVVVVLLSVVVQMM
jgi:alpha,alpha-trehalase